MSDNREEENGVFEMTGSQSFDCWMSGGESYVHCQKSLHVCDHVFFHDLGCVSENGSENGSESGDAE